VSAAGECTGKVAYSTWSAAERDAQRLRRRKGAHATAYRCRSCGSAHVGNAIGPKGLAARIRRQKLQKIVDREAWS